MRRDRMRVSTVWPGGLYTQNTPLSALYTVGAYTSMDIMHWDSPTSISAHAQATSMLCNTTDDCQHSLDCDHDLSRRIMEVENTSESHTSTSITATCVCDVIHFIFTKRHVQLPRYATLQATVSTTDLEYQTTSLWSTLERWLADGLTTLLTDMTIRYILADDTCTWRTL